MLFSSFKPRKARKSRAVPYVKLTRIIFVLLVLRLLMCIVYRKGVQVASKRLLVHYGAGFLMSHTDCILKNRKYSTTVIQPYRLLHPTI